jgi:hypothetical protein
MHLLHVSRQRHQTLNTFASKAHTALQPSIQSCKGAMVSDETAIDAAKPRVSEN